VLLGKVEVGCMNLYITVYSENMMMLQIQDVADDVVLLSCRYCCCCVVDVVDEDGRSSAP
jgi:hypothetical protein